MKHTILAAVMAVTLSACSTSEILSVFEGDLSLLEDVAEKAGNVEDATLGNAMKALPKYCKLPSAARKVARARINGRMEAQGNMIGVWCIGDPVLTLGQ